MRMLRGRNENDMDKECMRTIIIQMQKRFVLLKRSRKVLLYSTLIGTTGEPVHYSLVNSFASGVYESENAVVHL